MTREQIWKDPWFGDQREAVLALLDRAEKAEREHQETVDALAERIRKHTVDQKRAELAEKRLELVLNEAVRIVDHMPALSEVGQADSDMRADLQRGLFALARRAT